MEQVNDELAQIRIPNTLNKHTRLATKINCSFKEYKQEKMAAYLPLLEATKTSAFPLPTNAPKPMQLSLVYPVLSPEMQLLCGQSKLCLYGGSFQL